MVDLHVYGGILLLAIGVSMHDIPLGLCVAGAALLYIGLRGT